VVVVVLVVVVEVVVVVVVVELVVVVVVVVVVVPCHVSPSFRKCTSARCATAANSFTSYFDFCRRLSSKSVRICIIIS